MRKETLENVIIDIAMQLEKFNYLERLLYLFTFLFLKVTFDTLAFKKKNYEKKYIGQVNKIQRLMKQQPIFVKEEWNEIYEKAKYPEFGYYLNQYLHQIEEKNPCLRGIFKEIDFSKMTYESLKEVIEKLNKTPFAVTNQQDRETLGEVLDAVIFDTKMESGFHKITAGTDFTPMDVTKLIAKLVSVKENEEVADLVCGSGGLLLQTQKEITNQKVQIYGQEKNRKILKFCQLNLVLHGIYDAILREADTIEQNFGEKKFDVIVANPPFSTQNNLKYRIEEENGSIYRKKYPYGIPPASKADYAFIQNMLQNLKSDGRMAIIIALGALSRTGAEAEIRKRMLEDNIIETIILLPPNLFRNTGIKTCVMIFRKNRVQNDILFIDASQKFEKGRLQNYLSKEHVERILEVYKERKNSNGFSYVATVQEVLENGGNLSVNKYVIEEKENNIDLEQIRLKINDTEEQLKILKDKKEFYASKLFHMRLWEERK